MSNVMKLKDVLLADNSEIMNFTSVELRNICDWDRITDGRINYLMNEALSLGMRIGREANKSYSVRFVGTPTDELMNLLVVAEMC